MQPAEMLAAARQGFAFIGERYAELVESVRDTTTAIPNSEWTVRDAAVHLAGSNHRLAGLASGQASTVPTVDKQYLDARARKLIAENPETDGKKLADQIREGLGRVLALTETLPGDQPITFHAGIQLDLGELLALYVGEYLLHGYDIAAAVHRPWQIDPHHAALGVCGFRPCYPAIFKSASAAGLHVTYRLDTAGTEPFFLRIAALTCEKISSPESVDCVISADPMTALLVMTGRLSQWAAIALGRLTFSGERPDVGPRFDGLFVFP
jgi:uncharacterized protein (TIGR03083 family)